MAFVPLVLPTGTKLLLWMVLHQQKGSSSAYAEANFPVGADMQTFKLCSIAACAVTFNRMILLWQK